MLKSYNDGKAEIIRYYFKKPGYVRMEFVAPFNGAVLIYSPLTKQAKLWPFGYRSFPSFNLSPDNGLIQSRIATRGEGIDGVYEDGAVGREILPQCDRAGKAVNGHRVRCRQLINELPGRGLFGSEV